MSYEERNERFIRHLQIGLQTLYPSFVHVFRADSTGDVGHDLFTLRAGKNSIYPKEICYVSLARDRGGLPHCFKVSDRKAREIVRSVVSEHFGQDSVEI